MINITHIITGLDVGGAERALYNLLMNGLEGRFRNRVISLTGVGHYGPLLEDAGIPVSHLNMQPGKPTLGAMRHLLAVSAEAPTDIVQGWMIHGNLAATLVRWRRHRQAALAWNVRTSLPNKDGTKASTRALTRLGAWLSGQPDAIIYNSRRSQEQYEEKGYRSGVGHHLPNGFDVETWRPDQSRRDAVRRQLGLSESAQVIGFVGRAHPQKDLPNLFSAFDLIAADHPDAVLVAVGRDIAPYAGDRRGVVVLGERSDVPDLMRAFDLLCLSSRAEGFPNVIGEAMATGVPCVTTDVGDAGEIIGDTGWVVCPSDSIALSRALSEALHTSPDERRIRSIAARHRIKQDFLISGVYQQYTNIYNKIFSKNTDKSSSAIAQKGNSL